MIETPELVATRDYRRRQARNRGIVKAARALYFATEGDVLEWMTDGDGFDMAVQVRHDTREIRVWAHVPVDPLPAARRFRLPNAECLVFELVFSPSGREDPDGYADTIDAYVPGDWEVGLLTFTSETILTYRFGERTRAISNELKDRDALTREMLRWDV